MTDKKINLLNFIKGCIVVIGFIAMLLVWPYGSIKNIVSTSSVGENNQRTGAISEGITVLQEFVPLYDYIESIGILINKQDGQVTEGNLLLVFANADFTQCIEVKVSISEMEERGYYDIPIEQQVIPGQTYYYSITSADTGETAPLLIYRRLNTAGPSENKQLFYDGGLISNGTLACEYSYQIPLRVSQIATYYGFIVVIVMLLWMILDKLLREKLKVKKISIDKTIRVVGSLGWTIAMIACSYYLLVQRVFGGTIWDMGVYLTAIIFSSVIALIIIWKSVIPCCKISFKNIVQKIPMVLQIFAFAFYFIRYAYYFNSGVNYGHYINTNYMNIAFGVVMLTIFTRKEIFSVLNLLYSVIYGGICGWWIATNNYNYDTRTLYLLGIVVGWLWGMVIIRTIINLFHKKVRSFCISYAMLVFGFFALLIIFRNTRQWPVYMVVFFVLFYLQKIDESKMEWIFRNLCNGAMLSFYYFVGMSLLYRPYYYFSYSRYPGPFSSVAIWGIYLLFVFCTMFTKVVVEYRKDNSLKHMWYSYFTLGLCLSYAYMSVSRTALLGIVVISVITFILLALFWYRGKIRKLLIHYSYIAISFVLLFPGVYTATRCIPAIISNPIILNYEEFYGTIHMGEPIDSNKYMNFSRFMEISLGKLWSTFMVQVDTDNKVSNTQTLENDGELTQTAEQTANVIEEVAVEQGNTSDGELSNGRFEIFAMYLKHLNWTGHDVMMVEDGEIDSGHAHNTFIQSTYDHGIPTGIIFVLLGIVSFFRSVIYFKNKSETHLFTLLPAVVIIAFGIAGMTEWIFHPSIPFTLAFLLIQTPLLSKLGRK